MNVAVLRTLIVTKLQNRRFLRNSGTLMLANIIVTGLALIRTPAMTWLLPKAEYGMMGVVGAWLPFVQLLSLPGMDSASAHSLARGHKWALSANLRSRFYGSLLSGLAFGVGAIYWWQQGNILLAWFFIIAGLTYPVTNGFTALGGTLSATENFVGLFWYRLGESITDFAGFIPLLLSMWWISKGVTFYAANQLATAAMMVGGSWWLLKQFNKAGTLVPPTEEYAEMVRYGRHQTAIISIGVIQGRIDTLLISIFFPLTIVADYSIGLIIANQFRALWGIYLSIRYTPLVRMPIERRRRRFIGEGALVWVSFIGLGFLGYLFSQWVIPLLLPASYGSSIPYIGWLSAITLIGMPGGIAETYFRTERKETPQYQMRIVGALTSLALPTLLMFFWGTTGVMLGRLLSNGIFSLFGIWLFVTEKR